MNGRDGFAHASDGPMCPVTYVREIRSWGVDEFYVAGWEWSESLGLLCTRASYLRADSCQIKVMPQGTYTSSYPFERIVRRG